MSLQIKVHGATPTSGKSICHTCKHATVMVGQNCEERIVCNAGLWNSKDSVGIVRFRVAMCGSFHPTNMPWLHEMEQMAWMVEARKRGPTGFQQPLEEPMEITITSPRDRGISPNAPTPQVTGMIGGAPETEGKAKCGSEQDESDLSH